MNKKVTHEIKLEKSVKLILGVLAIGILLNVFNPNDFGIKEAIAQLSNYDTLSISHSGHISISQ